MDSHQINEELLSFIEASPSPFHAVDRMKKILLSQGFTELSESQDYQIEAGRGYFVTRNLSSIIAFRVPTEWTAGFMITAAHSDSPTFKIKDDPELSGNGYLRLNTERYGGMIYDSWFDRPLGVAGRIMVRTENGIETRLVSTDRDVAIIPHVAIHMLKVNEGYAYDPKTDLVPLFSLGNEKGSFLDLIAETANVDREDILSHELFLVNRQKPTLWGVHDEFLSSPKLDDLQCAFSALKALLSCEENCAMPVMYIADNEEVGSGTKQGAASTFLYDTLTRVCDALALTKTDFLRAVASSMLLSADNAHAVHPNHPELADPTHRPAMNGGVVMKYNASQLYTTDALSAALFRTICERADVPVQVFCNRSDLRGGSTLGNISNTQVSLNAVDIGVAQLAMHSSYETCGAEDTAYMIRAMREFFSTALEMTDGKIELY